MSAMHWEARRRQTALDRRMAREKQPLLHMRSCSDTISNATKSNATQEQLAGGQYHCEGDLKMDDHHNPKIPNRFSSLQYTQQW